MNKSSPTKNSPVIFPYIVGPKVRDFSTSLLYHGKLNLPLGSWISNDPLDAFYKIGSRAQQRQSSLSTLLNFVVHHFHTSLEVGHKEIEHLKPLGNKISNIILVHPGTPEIYSRWDQFHAECLPIAMHSLENVHVLHATIADFIFRTYEISLIENHDPDKVLSQLESRAKLIGGDMFLLAECALNRFSIPAGGYGEWVTDLPHIPSVLEVVKRNGSPPSETNEIRASGLAFSIFDHLLRPYTPKLNTQGIERINFLMGNHEKEIIQMKAKCFAEASELVNKSPSEAHARDLFKATLLNFEEEVGYIAGLEKNAFKEMIRKVLEDNTSWATFAGFVGAGVAGMPASLVATLGIAALSSVGSNAFKAKFEAERKLQESPWALVHFVSSK